MPGLSDFVSLRPNGNAGKVTLSSFESHHDPAAVTSPVDITAAPGAMTVSDDIHDPSSLKNGIGSDVTFDPSRNAIRCNLLPNSTAATRKQKNEDFCLIYKLPNEILKLIFEFIGEKNYRFVVCTSYGFQQVYLDTFGGEKLTIIRNAAVSVSWAAVCLDLEEEPGCDINAVSLFKTAAKEGKVEIFKWGED